MSQDARPNRARAAIVWSMSLTLILSGLIAALTLAPSAVAGGPWWIDKVYHLLAFAALAFSVPLIRPHLTPWVIVLVTAYGGGIELIQPLYGRQAEWGDLLADGIGAVIGATLGCLLSARAARILSARSG